MAADALRDYRVSVFQALTPDVRIAAEIVSRETGIPIDIVPRSPHEEILRLHGFPAGFRFTEGLSRRGRWKLAGNSVHVDCVRRASDRWTRPEAA